MAGEDRRRAARRPDSHLQLRYRHGGRGCARRGSARRADPQGQRRDGPSHRRHREARGRRRRLRRAPHRPLVAAVLAAPLKVAVLISGRGANLQALIDAFGPKVADSPVKIALVLSNRPDAPGLERAAEAGLKTEIVDHKAFQSREDFDVAMDREIRAAGAEFVVLAGFMRLLTPQFVTTWKDKLVNMHPALLPAFPGLHTHRRALEAGVRF